MRKLMKRKVNLFGKEISVFVISLFAIAIVSAALLTVYGTITGSATVEQSVVLTPVNPVFTFPGDSFVTGKSFTDCGYSVKNHAEVEAPVKLVIDQQPSDVSGIPGEVAGIDTEVYGVLELTKKDTTSWTPTGDKIEITYTIVGNTFVATGVPTGYTLIYYKDHEENAGDAERLTVLGESGGFVSSIPHANDWNIGPLANYCDNTYDNYEHCKGAKIWAVPDGNIDTSGSLIWSNPEDFYFETDLIVYSDSTLGEITLPAGGGFDFCVDNSFALDLVPDTYTIDVSIVPQ